MELTDAERAEFTALAASTLDPQLWSEDDLPLLRKIRDDCDKQQAQESAPLSDEQPDIVEDDEHTWPDSDDA
jgi:hypothetical protein